MRNLQILVWICLIAIGAAAQNSYGEQSDLGKAPMVKNSEKRTPRQVIDHRLSSMTQSLDLTSEQQASIKYILEDERAQLDEMANNRALSKEVWRNQIDALRKTTSDKIQLLLNDNQRIKYVMDREKALEKRKQREGKNPNVSPAN